MAEPTPIPRPEQMPPWSSGPPPGPQPRRVEFAEDQELLIILPSRPEPIIHRATIIEITESGQLWLIGKTEEGQRLVAIYAEAAWSSIRPLSG
jgi:hypothetical protein